MPIPPQAPPSSKLYPQISQEYPNPEFKSAPVYSLPACAAGGGGGERRRGRCRGSGGPSQPEEVPASPSPGSETRGPGRPAPPSLPPSLLSVSSPLRLCRPWAGLPPSRRRHHHQHVARVEQTRGGEERRRQPEAAPEPQRVLAGRQQRQLGRGQQRAGAQGAEEEEARGPADPADPAPGVLENETKPEDCIPDVPGNENAREFLAHAPTKGLWMPLGKEVKVMQCWRCKRYGHRTGDKECPFFIKGNQKLEQFRVAHEDPMYDIIRENKRHEKEMRIQQLKQLLEDSTSDDDSSSESSSSSGGKGRHKKKKKEKKKKEKKKKKKRKHKSSKSDRRSESD